MTSLRRSLLVWLLVPLFLGWGVNAVLTYWTVADTANAAYDRTLLGAALAIAEKVTVQDERVSVDLPYAALEMLESNLQGRVYYRVSTLERGLVTGYDDLPFPATWPRAEREPQYSEIDYRGERIRLVALLRPIYDPGIQDTALVQVGETLEQRQAVSRQLFLASSLKELALILSAAVLIWFAVARTLEPLLRARAEVTRRERTDLQPIGTAGVPREIMPLVDAINTHMARLADMIERQRRFVGDASHQLRTPLTVLKTQAELALRQPDLPAMRAILAEVLASTETMERLVRQLLALARAEPGARPVMQAIDLAELARAASADWAARALEKRIDLGYEGAERALVHGNALLLTELLQNLLDNAIRYTPAGGEVTVRVGDQSLEVEDGGRGIAPAERGRVFERFYRIAGSAGDGCGLGLAIVKEICEAHGAQISLAEGTKGRGLCVSVRFIAPAASAEPGRRSQRQPA